MRNDGRNLQQYRQYHVETDVFPHSNGSSRVVVADAIDIMCSVRVDVQEPNVSSPEEGALTILVQYSPACMPGGEDSFRYAEERGERMSAVLQR